MQVVGVHSFNNDDNYMHTEYMQLFLDDILIKEEDTLIQKEKQKKINSIAVVLVTICLV